MLANRGRRDGKREKLSMGKRARSRVKTLRHWGTIKRWINHRWAGLRTAPNRCFIGTGTLRHLAVTALLITVALFTAAPATAKYASLVVDAKTGRILHAVNADTRNYPASLTKMMTLYKVFEALKSGRWTMNTRLRVSRRSAAQPASKLGLLPGDTISVRDAILALAVKSANDIATAVAENHSGRERDFALKMTDTARQLGMSRTTFRNASGLPHRSQMSTARDMARLALALMRDFPQHYHFFARTSFEFRGTSHKTHNRLLLTYDGADGFKTGYIRASGFNLVTSAKRDGRRLIGVVFGAKSSSTRNHLMAKFMDKGFRQLNGHADVQTASKTAATSNTTRQPAPPPKAAQPDPAQQFSKGSRWAIQVGAYAKKQQAREMAVKAVATLPSLLEDGVTQVVPLTKRNGRVLHRARVYGLSKTEAYRACKLLERRHMPCMELRAPKALELAELTRPG